MDKLNKIWKRFWWLGPLLLFDICYYYFVLYLIENKGEINLSEFRIDGIIFLFLISLFSIFCVRLVKQWLGQLDQFSLPLKYTFVLLLSTLLFLGVVMGFQYGVEVYLGQKQTLSFYLNNMILIGFMHLVVANATVGVSYFNESLMLKVQIEQKDRRQSEMELQMLRQQMSPHFLFNNLNTLSSLITQDQSVAKAYTQRLAKLYRYATQVAREDLVKLSEELEFVENYLALAQLRFGDIYQLQMDLTDEQISQGLIIPMSFQTVLENVLKHNYGIREQPLRVKISSEENSLLVANEVRLKEGVKDTLGVGLENLKAQYALLCKQPLTYGPQGDQFIVSIPLIKEPS